MQKIKFSYIDKNKFELLRVKDPSTVYFVNGGGIYKGDKCFSGTDIVITVGENKKDEIIISNSDGAPIASGKKIGSDIIAEIPDDNTIATELGVINAIEKHSEWQKI